MMYKYDLSEQLFFFFFARCEIILTFCHKVRIFNLSDH